MTRTFRAEDSVIMSSRGDETCDCVTAKMFPHRRKKCALGIGKSRDVARKDETLVTQQEVANETLVTQSVCAVACVPSQEVQVEAQCVIPISAGNHSQQAPRPSLSNRIASAFEDGVVSGVNLGATLGTADVVRKGVRDGSNAVLGVVGGVFSAAVKSAKK